MAEVLLYYMLKKKSLKFHIIIQARYESKRFKGKILKKIKNKEILLIMVERLKKFKKNIIINISKKNSGKIVSFCKKNNLNYFIGSDKNVLKRFFNCAKNFNSKIIVRIPSDCPLIDYKIVEKGLNTFKKKKYSYVSNLEPPSYIDGNDVEILNFKTLKKIYKNAKTDFDKEHVTTFLRRDLKKVKYKNFGDIEDLSNTFRYTLDYKEDLMVIKQIIFKLGFFANYKKISYFLKKNKNISNLNQKYIGTMWYQKSL